MRFDRGQLNEAYDKAREEAALSGVPRFITEDDDGYTVSYILPPFGTGHLRIEPTGEVRLTQPFRGDEPQNSD